MTFMEPLRLVKRAHNDIVRPFLWHVDGIRHRRHNGIGLEITVDHKRADGTTKYKKTFKARSYVTNYLLFLAELMDTSNVTVAKDTGGTDRTVTESGTSATTYNVAVGGGDATLGIVVGTGTNTPLPADYQLQIPIAHGTGAGQLSYGACSAGGVGAVGNRSSFTVTRGFTNNSGSPITVNEVALYCHHRVSSAWRFMITRDKLPSGRTISNTESVTFTVKIYVDT